MLRVFVVSVSIVLLCSAGAVGQTSKSALSSRLSQADAHLDHEDIVLLGMPSHPQNSLSWLYKRNFGRTVPYTAAELGSIPQMAWKTHRPPAVRVQRRPAEIAPLLSEPHWFDASDNHPPLFPSIDVKNSPVAVSTEFQSEPYNTHQELIANRDVTPLVETKVKSVESTENSAKTVPVAALNLKVLRERIQKHNFNVDSIERRLQEQEYWDVAGLRALVAEIAEVIQSRNLWDLYFESLDLFQKRKLKAPKSLKLTGELLRQRIFEAQVELDIDDSLSDERRQKETTWLDAMDERAKSWLLDVQ